MTNPIYILFCESPFQTISDVSKIIIDQNDFMIFFISSNIKNRVHKVLSSVI